MYVRLGKGCFGGASLMSSARVQYCDHVFYLISFFSCFSCLTWNLTHTLIYWVVLKAGLLLSLIRSIYRLVIIAIFVKSVKELPLCKNL